MAVIKILKCKLLNQLFLCIFGEFSLAMRNYCSIENELHWGLRFSMGLGDCYISENDVAELFLG